MTQDIECVDLNGDGVIDAVMIVNTGGEVWNAIPAIQPFAGGRECGPSPSLCDDCGSCLSGQSCSTLGLCE